MEIAAFLLALVQMESRVWNGATSIPAFRTPDRDLGTFTTRTLSFKATFLKCWLFGEELDLMADVADRATESAGSP